MIVARQDGSFARRFSRRRAVTLLEVVLALGILGFVSNLTYWFYASSLQTNREGTAAAQKLRLARVALDRIALEIRQAAPIKVDGRVGIRGEAERIWLSSYRVPTRAQSKERGLRDRPRPGEYDLAKIEYKIVRHPEIEHPDGYEMPLGLARVEIMIPRPDPRPRLEEGEEEEKGGGASGEGGERGLAGNLPLEDFLFGDEDDNQADLGPEIQWDELYAPEIRYLRLCYYDGAKWWDTWDVEGDSPLPQLVQVTVGFAPQPPFGDEELGLGEIARINEEYCTCLNEDPVDCEPLAEDQYSTVVRVPQADPLFRSRITRESKGLLEELLGGEEEGEGDWGGEGP